jgi:hypothetical protein
LKISRPRYQQGNITKLERLGGFVWKVRFSEWIDGKRRQKALTFSGADYPTEMDVRKAIEFTVIQMNSDTERATEIACSSAVRHAPLDGRRVNRDIYLPSKQEKVESLSGRPENPLAATTSIC